MSEAKVSENEERLNLETITWGDLTWVSISPPTEKETKYLAEHYNFHQLALDDCLSRIQRPKVDTYKEYLFWVLHFPVYNKEKRIATHAQISVFIANEYIITLQDGDVRPPLQLFQECKNSEETLRSHFTSGSAYLFYKILDRAIDAYFPVLDKILKMIDEIEDGVFDETKEVAHEVSILRRDIITQRRIVFPMRTVMTEMENKLKPFSNIDMNIYFGDLLDHVNKQCETLDECKEVIEVFKDADYVLSADRLNRIMRTLTIISTIMLPLIVLSGLWSMNIPLPFGADPGGTHTFFYVMVAILVIVVGGMLYIFHRKHWI